MTKRAVFLDRDKTIIRDPGYIDDPDKVELLPGAAEAIASLNKAGFFVVIASNQSAVARGYITEEQLGEIHERLHEVLKEQGAKVDAVYYCPYLNGPQAVVEQYRRASDLRKPKPGMLLMAAEDHDIDLRDSWMVGDSARDVFAGQSAGCRTILIRDGEATGSLHDDESGEVCKPSWVSDSLKSAAEFILANADSPVGKVKDAGEVKPAVAEEIGAGTVLVEIRNMLRRYDRSQRQDDFSVTRLVGTLAQMLALVAGAWGLAALYSTHGDSSAAIARLLLAILFQLLAMTAFLTGSKK